ncbi:MAG: hypothetical protein V4579_06885 [Pseudomonadota bacterium]
MSVSDDFYITQAQICAKAADDTSLPMLQEKYRRAEAAWNTLANREADIKSARQRRESEKAAVETVWVPAPPQ